MRTVAYIALAIVGIWFFFIRPRKAYAGMVLQRQTARPDIATEIGILGGTALGTAISDSLYHSNESTIDISENRMY